MHLCHGFILSRARRLTKRLAYPRTAPHWCSHSNRYARRIRRSRPFRSYWQNCELIRGPMSPPRHISLTHFNGITRLKSDPAADGFNASKVDLRQPDGDANRRFSSPSFRRHDQEQINRRTPLPVDGTALHSDAVRRVSGQARIAAKPHLPATMALARGTVGAWRTVSNVV